MLLRAPVTSERVRSSSTICLSSVTTLLFVIASRGLDCREALARQNIAGAIRRSKTPLGSHHSVLTPWSLLRPKPRMAVSASRWSPEPPKSVDIEAKAPDLHRLYPRGEVTETDPAGSDQLGPALHDLRPLVAAEARLGP